MFCSILLYIGLIYFNCSLTYTTNRTWWQRTPWKFGGMWRQLHKVRRQTQGHDTHSALHNLYYWRRVFNSRH